MSPSENNITPSLRCTDIPRISLQIIIHTIEIARLQAVNFDNPSLITVPSSEHIRLLANAQRTCEPLKIPLAHKLENIPFSKQIKHIVKSLILLLLNSSHTGHRNIQELRVYKCAGSTIFINPQNVNY